MRIWSESARSLAIICDCRLRVVVDEFQGALDAESVHGVGILRKDLAAEHDDLRLEPHGMRRIFQVGEQIQFRQLHLGFIAGRPPNTSKFAPIIRSSVLPGSFKLGRFRRR
jgi:ABC-type histidine transport system ATPase subunit